MEQPRLFIDNPITTELLVANKMKKMMVSYDLKQFSDAIVKDKYAIRAIQDYIWARHCNFRDSSEYAAELYKAAAKAIENHAYSLVAEGTK